MCRLISVIVPTLNEEKYLESTLKSIRSQDYKGKYELIVADGKSKDKTVQIAKKYADKVIMVEKRGISAGRNAGAKIAKGETLLFVDADTVLWFNVLTEFTKVFKKKGIVGATCPVIPMSSKAADFLLYWIGNQFQKTSTMVNNPQVVGMCCACRRDVFEKIGGFDEKLSTSEDLDLYKRISEFGNVSFAEGTLALTSVRRLKAWGRFGSAFKHLYYYLKYILTGKGYRYKPIR